MENKIMEEKPEQSKFFGMLQEKFEYPNNKFVNEKIYVIKMSNPKAKVELPWTLAEIFPKMFEAIADKNNSDFLRKYYFNKFVNGNDEYKKLVEMVSGNVYSILLGKNEHGYSLTIQDDFMNVWAIFSISNICNIGDKFSASIGIKLVSGNKTIVQAINLSTLMGEVKLKGVDEI